MDGRDRLFFSSDKKKQSPMKILCLPIRRSFYSVNGTLYRNASAFTTLNNENWVMSIRGGKSQSLPVNGVSRGEKGSN